MKISGSAHVLVSKTCKVCALCPVVNAKSVTNLLDNCINDKFSNGDKDFKYFKTTQYSKYNYI